MFNRKQQNNNPNIDEGNEEGSYYSAYDNYSYEPVDINDFAPGSLVFDMKSLPIYQGYLYKKGGVVNSGKIGRRNWKKRWFQLNPIQYRGVVAYELQYYDRPPNENEAYGNVLFPTSSVQLKGSIGLFDVEIYSESTKSIHSRAKFEFQILLQNGNILQLACDTSVEREDWIESLNLTIAYHRKILQSSGYSLDGYDPIFEDEDECYELGERIAQNCFATGPGIIGAEAGKMTMFTVQVNDLSNQPTTEGGMPIIASLMNDDYLYYIQILDNNDGKYSGYYSVATAGFFDLNIMLNDEHHIFGSPFPVEILGASTFPEYCVAQGLGLEEVSLDCSAEFQIISKDIFHNKKRNGGDPFEVSVIGPANIQSLVDNNNGTYTCVYESVSNQGNDSPVLISITLFGKHIEGSPFNPSVVKSGHTSVPKQAFNHASIPVTIEDPVKMQETQYNLAGPLNSSSTYPRQENAQYHYTASTDNSILKKTSNTETTQMAQLSIADLDDNKGKGSYIHQVDSDPKMKESIPETKKDNRLEKARQRAMLLQQQSQASSNQYLSRDTQSINNQAVDHVSHHSWESPTTLSSQSTSLPIHMPGSSTATTSRNPKDHIKIPKNERRSSIQRNDIDPITGLPIVENKNTQKSPIVHFKSTDDFEPQDQSNNLLPTSVPIKSQYRSHLQRSDIDPISGLQINSQPKSAAISSSSVLKGRNRQDRKNAILVAMKSFSDIDNGKGFTHDEIDSILTQLYEGMVGILSDQFTDAQKLMWSITHETLQSSDIVHKIASDLCLIHSCFGLISEVIEGIPVVRLTSSNNTGIFRLLEEFNIMPSYINMKEVKWAYALLLSSQVSP